MQALKIKDILQLIAAIGQNYYPETMGYAWRRTLFLFLFILCSMTFIINAPWLFDTIWGFVKMWLDEVTVNKIKIFKSGKDYMPTLLQYVDKERLPFSLGGSCQCEGGCELADPGPWQN